MKTICTLYIFVAFLALVIAQKQDDIVLQTSSPDSVKYSLDSYFGYCEACLGFALAKEESGYFRLTYEELREIDQNGNECCASGETGCTANVGCNWHALRKFPKLFNETYSNTTARINGTVKSSGNSADCTPGTISSGSVCATFDWYYELINETTNMTVGNYTFPLYKNMLMIRFTISNWVYASSSSKGLRLKLGWGTEDVTCEDWYMNPGAVEVDDENMNVFGSNYTSCRVKDFYDRTGELFFTPFAFVNSYTSNPIPVAVTGPIDYSQPDAREFYIDFPQLMGNPSLTYYMGVAIPKASGLGKAGRMTASMMTTFGLAVLPFIL